MDLGFSFETEDFPKSDCWTQGGVRTTTASKKTFLWNFGGYHLFTKFLSEVSISNKSPSANVALRICGVAVQCWLSHLSASPGAAVGVTEGTHALETLCLLHWTAPGICPMPEVCKFGSWGSVSMCHHSHHSRQFVRVRHSGATIA